MINGKALKQAMKASVRDPYEGNWSPRIVDFMLASDGWDDPKALPRLRGMSEIRTSAQELKNALCVGLLSVATEWDLLRLTEMYDCSWSRYVDPALSFADSNLPTHFTVVLWSEDEVVELEGSGRTWRVVSECEHESAAPVSARRDVGAQIRPVQIAAPFCVDKQSRENRPAERELNMKELLDFFMI